VDPRDLARLDQVAPRPLVGLEVAQLSQGSAGHGSTAVGQHERAAAALADLPRVEVVAAQPPPNQVATLNRLGVPADEVGAGAVDRRLVTGESTAGSRLRERPRPLQ